MPSLPSIISPQGGECPRGKGGSSPGKVEIVFDDDHHIYNDDDDDDDGIS